MASHPVDPQNPEEHLIWWAIVGSWGIYVLGALYVTGPALGMVLLAIMAWRSYSSAWWPGHEPRPLPAGVYVWCFSMGLMLLSLLVVHLSDDLGFGTTLKSSIGWLKGWALLAVFPAVGAGLRIRPALVVRAMCWFAVQTLAAMPVLVLAGLLHLPSRLYVSPVQLVGGPGPEFFSVYLYIVDPSNGALRWQFTCPWAPAAGMMGNLIFFMGTYERTRWLRWAAMTCGVLMCLMTGSRMALLFLVVYPPLVWGLSRLSRWRMVVACAVGSLMAGMGADWLIGTVGEAVSRFKSARADSTRVREALGRIAVQRWWDDAPIWGHGVVVRGTHFVEFMPIGSHHTWYGLLYVKGVVGCVALAMALIWTFFELVLLAQVSRIGRIGLTTTFLLLFYSFGENLEILAYLAWPGLLMIGCAFGEASAAMGRSIPGARASGASAGA